MMSLGEEKVLFASTIWRSMGKDRAMAKNLLALCCKVVGTGEPTAGAGGSLRWSSARNKM